MAKNIGVRPPFNWGEVLSAVLLMVVWACLASVARHIQAENEVIALLKAFIKVMALPIIWIVGRVIFNIGRSLFKNFNRFEIHINWRLFRWYALKSSVPLMLIIIGGLSLSSYKLLRNDNVVAEVRVEKRATKKTVKVNYYQQVERLRFQKQLCHQWGYDRSDCWFTLEAIVVKETNGYGHVVNVGDGGPGRSSYCWYQINTIHRLSRNTMCSFEKATRWALAHMISNNYPENVFYSIKKHNGGGPKAEIYAHDVVGIRKGLLRRYSKGWDLNPLPVEEYRSLPTAKKVFEIAQALGISEAKAAELQIN